MSSIRKYFDNDNRFIEVFNPVNGFYLRTGVIDSEGNDTGIDPFMRNTGPSLCDIGIMGHCIHGSKGLCNEAGVQCYQGGSDNQKPNMTLDEYKSIVDQVKGYVFQVALGGHGDPNKHSQFEKVLEYTRANSIVPNYTTSGLELTQEEVDISRNYVGAVAVSMYNSTFTYKAIDMFLQSDIITNVHFVLSKTSIDRAIEILSKKDLPVGINAIIFLMHKPVGKGQISRCLSSTDLKVREFFDLVNNWDGPFKLGFDSCTTNAILNYTNKVDQNSIDTCEGARFSMYISSDMMAVPCSFDVNRQWGVDLHNFTIQEAWDSDQFYNFRNKLYTSCPSCSDRLNCYGGCPIVPDITLCSRKERE